MINTLGCDPIKAQRMKTWEASAGLISAKRKWLLSWSLTVSTINNRWKKRRGKWRDFTAHFVVVVPRENDSNPSPNKEISSRCTACCSMK
jgi:hypothetical protein